MWKKAWVFVGMFSVFKLVEWETLLKFRESCVIMGRSCQPPKGGQARATKRMRAPIVLAARPRSLMNLPMSWSDHRKALAMTA